jgi:hypothetical protein
VRVLLDADELAEHGTEANGIGNAAMASLAVVECSLGELGSRLALQKHDLGGIDGVRLQITDVHILAYVGNAHNIAVRRSAHLDCGMSTVRLCHASGTQRPFVTVEAEVILLVLPDAVDAAMAEELVN